MPSLAKILRRCHSTVRADRKSWAPISGLVRPSTASRVIEASCAVSSDADAAERLRTVSAQPLAVEQVGAAELGPQPGAAEPGDGLLVAALGRLAVRDLGPRARLDPEAEVGLPGLGELGQPGQGGPGGGSLPGADGGLDQLGQGPHGDEDRRGVLGGLPGGGQGLGVAAEAVAEDGRHPAGVRRGDALARGGGVGDGGLDQRGGFGRIAAERRQHHRRERGRAGPGRRAVPGVPHRRLRGYRDRPVPAVPDGLAQQLLAGVAVPAGARGRHRAHHAHPDAGRAEHGGLLRPGHRHLGGDVLPHPRRVVRRLDHGQHLRRRTPGTAGDCPWSARGYRPPR